LPLPKGRSPREQGRAHGEEMRPLIAEIAAIRTALCVELGAYAAEADVLDAARLHLPVLRRFDATLADELEGIAEGAGLAPERVVVVNHYTDLRDLDPGSLDAEDDCSAICTPSPEGPLLGQTWDMHGSAMPYVMMLGIPEHDGRPAAWLFTITGCLGMTGLNAEGVGITINNLRSTDARVGVVWPALVRRVLGEPTATAARDVILGATLGSGHHYLVADATHAYGIESSGQRRRVVHDDATRPYVHTNHCLSPEVDAVTTTSPTSTTHDRYAALTDSLERAPVADRADLWQRLGSHESYPRSVCTHLASPSDPHAMLTCGAIAMDLRRTDLWAAAGCVHSARAHRFAF
jgi:isopenicillin-N N-acyltransferase-like protein